MEDFQIQNIDKISHNIASLSKDMYEIKKTILSKEKEKEKLSKKDKKRRESLKKAQAKFKNVSTNLSTEDYEKFEKRLIELGMSKSAYLKKLIMDDLP
jgi:regulator of replication initiation timing